MKPKNLIFCIGCQKSKMLFESKAKADNFIKYNSKDIYEEKGKAPVRSYYCEMCGGFHVTSNPSEKAGEKLNQRDQKVISQVELGIKESEKYGSLQQSILEKIEIAKKQMYAGNFQYVEQLHDDIYRDSEFAFKLPLDKRSKYIALRQRIEILYKVSLLFKEINHTHVLIQNNEIEEAQSNIMVLHQQSANLKGGMFADVISKCRQNIEKIEKELSNKIVSTKKTDLIAENPAHTSIFRNSV